MSNLLSSFKEFLDSRVKNMLFMNFVLAWMIINYNIPMYLIFKNVDIEEKIKYIDNLHFSFGMHLFFPLLLSVVYIYLIPIINLLIVKLYDRYIHKFILEYEHKKKVNNFEHTRKEEEAKHNAITFVKTDMELKREKEKNNENERANKIEQDRIQSIKESNEAKQKEIILVDEENRKLEKNIELKEKELDYYKKLAETNFENIISVDTMELIKKLDKFNWEKVIRDNPNLVEVKTIAGGTSKNYTNPEIKKLQQKLLENTFRNILDDKIEKYPEYFIE